MSLTIHMPESCPAERRYVVSLVFGEFLGIPVRISVEPRSDVAITGTDGKELILADVFFPAAEKNWLAPASMPLRPLDWIELPNEIASPPLVERKLPMLFGESADAPLLVHESPTRLRSTLDVLGSIFFLVSRYEELAAPAADDRGRFPASASLAHQEGFLDRPLADEYVELLWTLLRQQWPGLERRQHRYRLYLSHDVDSPYRVLGRPVLDVALAAAADVALRRGIRAAANRLKNAYQVYKGNCGVDPYNTFAYIMSTSEAHSLRSAFYFITRRRMGRLDGTYRFHAPEVQQLIRTVHERGHEIGLHPGYSTFCSRRRIADEFSILREQCERIGIQQSRWGGRQHYLRWRNPTTWEAWEQAGLDYDSTLGYPDSIGFRCGTCREYSVYDLVGRRRLALRERPLIAMDCAMSYHFPKPDQACQEHVARLVTRCRRLKGNFTLLWHNNNLRTESQRCCYEEILRTAA